jgi:hypothetical protein
MKFQIISKTTGLPISSDLTEEEMIRRVSFRVQEMEEFLSLSQISSEKEFVIQAYDPKNNDWINSDPSRFTVIVRRVG